MRRLIRILFLWAMIFSCHWGHSQQFLLVENINNLKNFKYFPGDFIELKISSYHKKAEGYITSLTDSGIYISGIEKEVKYKDITKIYRDRHPLRLIRKFFLVAGAGYVTLDVFNRLINDDSPVVLTETLAIGAGLAGVDLLLLPLQKKRLSAKKYRMMTVDFSRLGYSGP